MKKLTTDVSKMSVAEIEKQIRQTKEEIAKLQLEVKVAPQKDTNIIKKKRKTVAVMLTLLGEKRLAETVQKESR